MAILDQINIVNCGSGGLLGTGHQACAFDWGRIKTVEISAANFVYLNDQTLSEIQMLQQKEEVFIISDFESFKLVPAAPTISTSAGSGDKSVEGELPYEYEATFKKKGMNFWKALRRFNSNGVYNVALYDVNGTKIMTQTKTGKIKGFSTNMIFTDQYVNANGADPSEIKMMIQLGDFKEMERASWISGDTSDYVISDLEGYNDIILTPAPLIAAATSLVVTTTLADKSHFVEGLVVADFDVRRDGVVVVVSAVLADPIAKTYTLTIPAATAGTYTVNTKNAFSKKVVLQTASGTLYKGIEGTVVVA